MNEQNQTTHEFNIETQRRALDHMSGQLLDKLNAMIAVQDARVKEFSLQEPAKTSAEPEHWFHTNTPEAKPSQELVISYSDGGRRGEVPNPRKKSVTPPPVTPRPSQPTAKPRPARQTPPPIRSNHNIPTVPKNGDKKESSVGCGTVAVIVTIIIILLRACS